MVVPLADSVEGEHSPREFVEDYVAKGNCCIGTTDDAIAYIDGLLEQSGGFGTLLINRLVRDFDGHVTRKATDTGILIRISLPDPAANRAISSDALPA